MPIQVTSKGQATIPKDVREHMGIAPGGSIEFFKQPDGSVYILPVLPLDLNRGVVRYSGHPKTVEEMDDAIGEEVAARDKRSKQK